MPGWNDCAFYHYDKLSDSWVHLCDNHLQPSDNCRYVDRCKLCPYYVGQLTIEEVLKEKCKV